MTYNESTKASIYKWRKQNAEAYLEIQRKINKAYYEKNRDALNAKRRQKRLEQKAVVVA
jgi:hypothetical protein